MSLVRKLIKSWQVKLFPCYSKFDILQFTSFNGIVCGSANVILTISQHKLCWFPVKQRIVFKLATLTFKARKLGHLVNLDNLLCKYQPTLRSSAADLLHQSSASTSFVPHVFSVDATAAINSRTTSSLSLGSKLNCSHCSFQPSPPRMV